MSNPYRELFQAPGALGFVLAGAIARLPLPMIGIGIITMLSKKVHILSTQIEDFAFNKPIVRVAKLIYLLHQRNAIAEHRQTGSIPFKQEDIGSILGIHRVTVNQALKRLKHIGALEDNNLIIVKDLDILKTVFQAAEK